MTRFYSTFSSLLVLGGRSSYFGVVEKKFIGIVPHQAKPKVWDRATSGGKADRAAKARRQRIDRSHRPTPCTLIRTSRGSSLNHVDADLSNTWAWGIRGIMKRKFQ